MTRINLVPPKELSRQHLLAEYRELPRVFSLARKRISFDQIRHPWHYGVPPQFTLGRGHMLFFTGRLLFLLVRYQSLIDEMRRREYKPKPVPLHRLVKGIPAIMFGNYTPTREALAASRQRIKERS